jgi:DNA-binding GntR family transcriptional regulator
VSVRPIDPFGAEYAYVQVADDIERRITEGEITAKLPSERSFAEEYAVAYTTVRHAMAVLRERGIIVTAHGRGTFVTPREPGLPPANPTRR